MRNPISLDQAEYKSALAASLFETILEKACAECSEMLSEPSSGRGYQQKSPRIDGRQINVYVLQHVTEEGEK